MTAVLPDARAVAETVTDPELPLVTLADLGVLRDVRIEDGTVVVEITPTYTGCPAMGVMRADLVHALHRAGFGAVDVRTVLSPAWSTDWISEEGRRKLAAYGIAPPSPRGEVRCPQCGSAEVEEISRFGSTPCKAQWRCKACLEPFDRFKCH